MIFDAFVKATNCS